MSVQNVAIIGTGLIGGSLGLALRALANPPRVIGWDVERAAATLAVSRGALDVAAATVQEAVIAADVIVFCVPVRALSDLTSEIVESLSPHAVVTDVCSVKVQVEVELGGILGKRFVGGHPMAGSERGGIQAARPDLFNGAAWALCPSEETDPSTVQVVSDLVSSIGARPIICSPTDHDRWVATLSHAPHVLAFGLAEVASKALNETGRQLAGPSFRDLTRVAASDPNLWAGILMANRFEVLNSMASFAEWWRKVEATLQDEDRDELRRLLTRQEPK